MELCVVSVLAYSIVSSSAQYALVRLRRVNLMGDMDDQRACVAVRVIVFIFVTALLVVQAVAV